MKEVEVVAGIIIYDSKILCTQRDISKNPEVSYKWEFPGGKVEDGESREDALRREIREELNMEIEIEKYFMEVNYDYPTFRLKMHTYICRTPSEQLKLNVHKDYKWLHSSQLHSLDWAEADNSIIESLANLEVC